MRTEPVLKQTQKGAAAALLMTLLAWPASGHPGHGSPGESSNEVRGGARREAAPSEVSIAIEGEYRVIRSNGLSPHAGRFPNAHNPNRISAQDYTFRAPLNPKAAPDATPLRHNLFGVALDGVPFDPGTAEFWNDDRRSGWNYEAMSGAINLGLDANNAHVQPTGAYHYHAIPTSLVKRAGGNANRMQLVGWAADGYPIYSAYGHTIVNNPASPLKKVRSSWRVRKGARPGGPGGKYDGTFTQDYEYVNGSGDLDECNGRFGVTPEFPQGTYHYYITDEFPYVPRFWHGTPDPSFEKTRPGLHRGGPEFSRNGGPEARNHRGHRR